ncbi:MAG: hypothetical protein ACRYGR_07605 [Janthinobacterium lividum]
MSFRLLSAVFMVMISINQSCYSTTFLKEEQIEGAIALNSNKIKFEEYLASEKTENDFTNKNWLTLQENYSFNYKEGDQEFYIANGFYRGSNYGRVALYSKNTNPTTIDYMGGRFSDFGRGVTPYNSLLEYEYVPATKNRASYFIVESVATSSKNRGKGFSQACLKYFLEFVNTRTNVKYAFSDLRNPICQKFFPNYGFERGVVTEFQDEKFKRPLDTPFSWKSKK